MNCGALPVSFRCICVPRSPVGTWAQSSSSRVLERALESTTSTGRQTPSRRQLKRRVLLVGFTEKKKAKQIVVSGIKTSSPSFGAG
mmetsp:Transcript_28656/g.61474  ORF Transcript_28656/g.61474 Transcript_28656/m.61474 type:complete len:86 (-) Transcript_28656:279-536(-)